MKALIVVVAFVTCAAAFARADQLKQTPEDSSCEVMPMDVIDNYLFFSRLNPVNPHTDLAAKDSYMVVYLDFLRGLGVYCELKDCSDAEPPPRSVRFGVLSDADFEKWKCGYTIHADELMKIPKVDRVDLQQAGRDILIDVQTKGDIDKVRKAVPPSLEGYKVEVTQFRYDAQLL